MEQVAAQQQNADCILGCTRNLDELSKWLASVGYNPNIPHL